MAPGHLQLTEKPGKLSLCPHQLCDYACHTKEQGEAHPGREAMDPKALSRNRPRACGMEDRQPVHTKAHTCSHAAGTYYHGAGAQRGDVTYPRSHSTEVREPGSTHIHCPPKVLFLATLVLAWNAPNSRDGTSSWHRRTWEEKQTLGPDQAQSLGASVALLHLLCVFQRTAD